MLGHVIWTTSIGNKQYSVRKYVWHLLCLCLASVCAFVWHLLRSIMLWTIWIDINHKVFNNTQWHETKVKHFIWDELMMHAKLTRARVLEFIEISPFSTVALLEGFDKTWGARGVLCRRDNLEVIWNWKWCSNYTKYDI